MQDDPNQQHKPPETATRQPNPDQPQPPGRNDAAAMARVFGLLSFIPGFALITGPVAVVFGGLGLRRNRAHPTLHGHRHSWLGIGVGGLFFVISVAFLAKVSIKSWTDYSRAQAGAAKTHSQDHTTGGKAPGAGAK